MEDSDDVRMSPLGRDVAVFLARVALVTKGTEERLESVLEETPLRTDRG